MLAILSIAWSFASGWIKTAFGFLWNLISDWPLKAYLVAIALVVAAVFISGRIGYRRGGDACEAAYKAAAAHEIARQHRAEQAAVAASNVRTTLSAKKDEQARVIVRIVKEIAHAQPDASRQCIAPAVADRLRDIP